MSDSRRISCTEGGGRAIARPTMPSSGGFGLRLCENVYCGRRWHNIRTTCKTNGRCGNLHRLVEVSLMVSEVVGEEAANIHSIIISHATS